ncbi:hypothetical protein GCM10027194_12100 [Thalassiella azotivora]
MNTRLSLHRRWPHSQEPTNITAYITTIPVRIIAAYRRYMFLIWWDWSCSWCSLLLDSWGAFVDTGTGSLRCFDPGCFRAPGISGRGSHAMLSSSSWHALSH